MKAVFHDISKTLFGVNAINISILTQLTRSSAAADKTARRPCVFRLTLYTRLASPVAVCIAIRGRYTQLAWLANPNPNPNLTNSSYC